MPALSYLRISGRPFEAGQALGHFGAAAVHQHLLTSPAWARVMAWRASAAVARMTALVHDRFPAVWAELRGLADGLRLPPEDVFLWNCRGDLWAMSPDGCTTVQIPGETVRRISHNEDGDPGFGGHCAIAECTVDGGPRFATFVYPGSLPGHTFAVTDLGLAMTVNNLRELHVDAGVPRMVLTRALLASPSLEAVVGMLREQPRAGGFHLTLGHRASPELLSIEFSSAACSVRTVVAPSLHSNHAIHPAMEDLPQIITGSSEHRQVRGNALIAEAVAAGGEIDPLAMLADTADARFPIHRADPTDGDNENTLATADIVIHAEGIEWQVYEHPLEAPRYRMTDGHPTAQAG